jgi:mRNA interferase RelE/StbE
MQATCRIAVMELTGTPAFDCPPPAHSPHSRSSALAGAAPREVGDPRPKAHRVLELQSAAAPTGARLPIDRNIALRYCPGMKAVRYSAEAIANLKRYGNMAARVRKAINEYAADPAAHANNVTRLVGSPASRMRVADYRVIFVETEQELVVTRIGPRGNVYD